MGMPTYYMLCRQRLYGLLNNVSHKPIFTEQGWIHMYGGQRFIVVRIRMFNKSGMDWDRIMYFGLIPFSSFGLLVLNVCPALAVRYI